MVHTVEITIDAREGGLRQWFEQVPKPNVTIANMEVGDILLKVDGVPALLIERKEANDFRSSVATNRFREQRSRLVDLMKEQPQLITAFLFEGDLGKLYYNQNSRIQRKTLEDLANDLGPKYGICRIESKNMMDTLRLIGRYENVYKEKGHPSNISQANNITESLSIGKKRGIDREAFAPCALSLIPGLTREAAMSITAVYPTLRSLITTLEGLDRESEREQLLVGFEYGDGLRVGPTVAKRIYHFLLDVKETPKKKLVRKPRERSRSPKRKSKYASSSDSESNPFEDPSPSPLPVQSTGPRKRVVLPRSSSSSSESEAADAWLEERRRKTALKFKKPVPDS